MAVIPASGDPGVAAATVATVSTSRLTPFYSDTPQPAVDHFEAIDDSDYELYQVVSVDVAAGTVIPAVLGTSEANGVMAMKVTGDSGGGPQAAVYRQGHFIMDQLIYDATYDTDAKKLNAFLGQETGATLLVTDVERALS